MEIRSSVNANFSIGTINTVNRISAIEKVGLNLIMIGYVVSQACYKSKGYDSLMITYHQASQNRFHHLQGQGIQQP